MMEKILITEHVLALQECRTEESEQRTNSDLPARSAQHTISERPCGAKSSEREKAIFVNIPLIKS
jgi:hypothetical protein